MTTCTVSGNITDIGFQPEVSAIVRFTPLKRSAFREGNSMVVPSFLEVTTDASGDFTIDLVPEGYRVEIYTDDSAGSAPLTITVPDAATAIFAQIVDLPLPDDLNAAEQAVADAEAARDAAEASATAAATSESNAAAIETAISNFESKAQEWAENPEDTEVETGLYSAKHHAAKASSSATAASGSASAASTSETNAANSASAASTSETSAAGSASAASTSETSAAASEAKAQDWAENAEDVEVETGLYSAKHHAAKAAASETNAANSASAASTSETNAATSATNAETSASEASTSAGNAATSAAAASNAQTAAETARDQTLTAFDNFDDRYLGQKSSAPTTDNDGNHLTGGALYFDTTSSAMRVYDANATQWIAAYSSLQDAVLKTNNLSDLSDPAAARTSLGLGTAATTDSADYAITAHTHTLSEITDAGSAASQDSAAFAAASHTHTLSDVTDAGTAAPLNVSATGDAASGEVVKGDDTRLTDARAPTAHTHTKAEISNFSDADYATAAQGSLADTATQPGDLATVATTGAYSDLSGTPNIPVSGTDFVDKTGGTFTGNVDVSAEFVATSYNETFSTVTSTSNLTTINCESGNVFSHTLTENTTFTFSNPSSSGTAYGFTLKLVQDATARTVTWPASVNWADATAPTISSGSGEVDVLVFFTHDGGATWYGFTAGQVMS